MSTNYLYLYISINSYIYILTNYLFFGLSWIVWVARSVTYRPTQKPRITRKQNHELISQHSDSNFRVGLERFRLNYRIY